jgi:hypothetical protein
MHTKLLPENINGKDHLGDLGVDGRILLQYVLKKYGMTMRTGFIWLKKGFSGWLL